MGLREAEEKRCERLSDRWWGMYTKVLEGVKNVVGRFYWKLLLRKKEDLP